MVKLLREIVLTYIIIMRWKKEKKKEKPRAKTWQRRSVVAPTQAGHRLVGLSKPTQTAKAIRAVTHAVRRLVIAGGGG